MPEFLPPFLLATAIFLAHCNFVQVWLSTRGGLSYVWDLKRSNATLTFARISLVLAVVSALLMLVESMRLVFALSAGAFAATHLVGVAVLKENF